MGFQALLAKLKNRDDTSETNQRNYFSCHISDLNNLSIYEATEIGLELTARDINALHVSINDEDSSLSLDDWNNLASFLILSEIKILRLQDGDLSLFSCEDLRSVWEMLNPLKLEGLELFNVDLWDFQPAQIRTLGMLRIFYLSLQDNNICSFSVNQWFALGVSLKTMGVTTLDITHNDDWYGWSEKKLEFLSLFHALENAKIQQLFFVAGNNFTLQQQQQLNRLMNLNTAPLSYLCLLAGQQSEESSLSRLPMEILLYICSYAFPYRKRDSLVPIFTGNTSLLFQKPIAKKIEVEKPEIVKETANCLLM